MDKQKALETALQQLEKQYGKGTVMRLGENAGIGDIVVPWVIDAVIASTIPKQWNIGT